MDVATKAILDAARLAVGGIVIGSSEGRSQCAAALASLNELEKHLDGLVADIRVVEEPNTSAETVAIVTESEPQQETEQTEDAPSNDESSGQADSGLDD